MNFIYWLEKSFGKRCRFVYVDASPHSVQGNALKKARYKRFREFPSRKKANAAAASLLTNNIYKVSTDFHTNRQKNTFTYLQPTTASLQILEFGAHKLGVQSTRGNQIFTILSIQEHVSG